MQSSLRSVIQAGIAYSKVWPQQSDLNSIFPENRIIALTQWAQKIAPPFVVLNAVLLVSWHGGTQLPLVIAMSLLLLSMPLHGWYWLGVRSQKKLPPPTRHWYQQIQQQMQQHGVATALPQKQALCYHDLGRLLQQAYRQLDRTFIRESLY
ncbi:MAG: DUF412 family protein [Alkalimonas sp.]|uniref:UPF0208 membrane protein YfbV n=1 Tax=Alkalimonas delamerensis TaxID=265981 RepID=A0ABT9GPF0_9GAMM|nr:terminus macrodomain insulation protein YfbV [Alkalimonas delamerensis]MCC5851316.1 DUF412 family protein [Alkalimonas sp.]MDP4528838.1 terminus macrodomain insulation protein YfbV [Alkalimonas delamerensis]